MISAKALLSKEIFLPEQQRRVVRICLNAQSDPISLNIEALYAIRGRKT